MMRPVERVLDTGASPVCGQVRVDPRKVIWIGLMLLGSLLAPFYASWSAVSVFLITSYLTLLIGHSIGMHRMMIHRSFRARPTVRRILIFMGVLVGMGGPSQIIKVHDTRDWAQRLPDCHPYFSHKRGYIQDLLWQLFCRFDFDHPLVLIIESEIVDDPYINFFDRYWMAIQFAFALSLFLCGGVAWVLWGCCLRVFVSVAGHWTVTYICHNPGPGRWQVEGAGVQASNLRFAGFITHGECWHNNHHAFPESAKIGLEPGQLDPAWMLIRWLEKRGLVYNVKSPRPNSERDDLVEI